MKWIECGGKLISTYGNLEHTIFYGGYTKKFSALSGIEYHPVQYDTQLEAIAACEKYDSSLRTG